MTTAAASAASSAASVIGSPESDSLWIAESDGEARDETASPVDEVASWGDASPGDEDATPVDEDAGEEERWAVEPLSSVRASWVTSFDLSIERVSGAAEQWCSIGAEDDSPTSSPRRAVSEDWCVFGEDMMSVSVECASTARRNGTVLGAWSWQNKTEWLKTILLCFRSWVFWSAHSLLTEAIERAQIAIFNYVVELNIQTPE